MKLPIQIKILIGVIIFLFIYSICSHLYTSTTSFYNNNKGYQFEYTQIDQDQITTFDNNYLIFTDKYSISEINKETFITVTQIIMSNRKDGQNLAWKWVKENQQIDYNEFTKFYTDLSNFTSERYKENNSLERRKQQIVKEQNVLISTFPGVIYNYFLKFDPLEYKAGFITQETKTLFGK